MEEAQVGRAPRYLFPKAYADVAQRGRVAGGFLLLVLFAWRSKPTFTSVLIGLPLSLFGLGLRAWAAGHLAKDRELAMSGPYAYLRNPLYAGTLIAAGGFALAAHSVALAVTASLVFMFVYLPAIELEEQHLREIFPAYKEYAAQIGRFLPSQHFPAATGHVFSGALYLRNEEYKAALGWAFAALWLLWRCWLDATVT